MWELQACNMTVEIAQGEATTVSIKAAQPSLPLLLPLEDSIPNECGLSFPGNDAADGDGWWPQRNVAILE